MNRQGMVGAANGGETCRFSMSMKATVRRG